MVGVYDDFSVIFEFRRYSTVKTRKKMVGGNGGLFILPHTKWRLHIALLTLCWNTDHKGTRFCSRKEVCHTTRQIVLRVQSTWANIAIATSYFWVASSGIALVILMLMPEGWHDGRKEEKKMPSDMQKPYWKNGQRGWQLMTLSLQEIWRAFWQSTSKQ